MFIGRHDPARAVIDNLFDVSPQRYDAPPLDWDALSQEDLARMEAEQKILTDAHPWDEDAYQRMANHNSAKAGRKITAATVVVRR